ncbi:MAG: ASCH domain-containing protein, partial [Pseudoxanthomonas sp.]|nr:ASCH domain-containing protein [Pseudoxanthomonas sp.]
EFAEKIADGSKTVELRKRFPAVPTGTWIYLYVTLPVGAVLGRAKVVDIDAAKPSKLWRRHHARVGISQERFNDYFNGRDEGYAVHLAQYESLSPMSLDGLRKAMNGFVVPQNYRFLDSSDQAAIHLATKDTDRPSRETKSRSRTSGGR